jgi:single-stranded DNA-binding protein
MGDLNKGSTIGRIGKDAGIFGQGTTKVLSFNVGSNYGWGDKKGTFWYKVTCFVGEKSMDRAKKLCELLKKGTEVFVTGDLSEEEYNDRKSLVLTVNMNDVVITKFKDKPKAAEAPDSPNDDSPTVGEDDGIPF